MRLAITTDRLDLAALREEHAEAMFPVLADAELYDYTGGRPPTSVSALRKRYAVQETLRSPDGNEIWLNWVITVRSSDDVIGYVQATIREEFAEVAWVVGTDWQGHGYATEAARGMLEWLNRVGIRRIRANIHSGHEASRHVAMKAGFRQTNELHLGEQIWEHSRSG